MRLLPLPGVFQPLSDSHTLADRLRNERLGPGVSVLDLCTGSGLRERGLLLSGDEEELIVVRAIASPRGG